MRGSTHQLVYASAGKAVMSPVELAELLVKARANNHRLGVSGMLVHHGGSFFQVLEGDEQVVEALFARISLDRRHHRVVVLIRHSVPAPTFGEWSMGFVEGTNTALKSLPGFNDFFRRGFELAQLSDSPGRVKELLLGFRGGRFRQFVDV